MKKRLNDDAGWVLFDLVFGILGIAAIVVGLFMILLIGLMIVG